MPVVYGSINNELSGMIIASTKMSRVTSLRDFVATTIFLIQTAILLGILLVHDVPPVSSSSLECFEGATACLDDSMCYTDTDRCDQINDCDDGSDEANCTMSLSCMGNEFYCSVDNECFPLSSRCDGTSDCSDGSDEADCDNVTCSLDSEFMCESDKQCIVGTLRCDGTQHCHDGSDERDCGDNVEGQPELSRCDPETSFDCNGDGSHCILLEKRCNSHNDCSNGEDELDDLCSSNSSESGCANQNGHCSHTCIETTHGHHCSCPEGYELDFLHTTCIGEEPELWATNGSNLIQYGLHSNDRKITNLGGIPHSVAYDRKNERIFWIDSQNKAIYWRNKDAAGPPQVLINTLIEVPAALAYDWVHDNLYWADAGPHARHTKIEVVTLGGNERLRTIVLGQPEVDRPKFMVVDPRADHGYLYWAQGTASPVIRRADLDGSDPETIISTDLGNVHGLALDLVQDRLFWVDSRLNLIASCDLDGGRREILVTFVDYPKHPIGIGVFEDSVYWADMEAKSVQKMYKFLLVDETHPTATTVLEHLTNPHSIEIYHKLKQPKGESYCGDDNGGCSHICLPTPRFSHYRCVCPLSTDKTKHYIVNPDNSSSCLLVDGAAILSTTASRNSSLPARTSSPETTTTSASSVRSQTNFINLKSPAVTTSTADGQLSTHGGSGGGGSNLGHSGSDGDSKGDNMWVYIGVAGAVGLLIILILSIVGYKLYARHVAKNLHFDNPVFEQKPLRNSERQADSRA